MTYDGAGNLYVCEHVTSSLVMETPSGERKVLASHWQGKELNSPNDVVLRSDNTIYFSDPSYGRMPVFGLERKQDLGFQGLFRISPDGKLHLEADDFGQTNGVCFSPDEKILYVNDSPRAHIRAFDVAPDGSLSNSRIFAENIGDGVLENGIVDGMKVDERGNIYVTGPRGIWVLSPDGGAPGRDSHARACRKPELGRAQLGRAVLCLLDVDLSREDESSRKSCRIHEYALRGNMADRKLNAKKTALIIQDLQNDVITEGGAFASSGAPAHAKKQNIVENVKKLAAAMRKAGRDRDSRSLHRRAGRAWTEVERAALSRFGGEQSGGARNVGSGARRGARAAKGRRARRENAHEWISRHQARHDSAGIWDRFAGDYRGLDEFFH